LRVLVGSKQREEKRKGREEKRRGEKGKMRKGSSKGRLYTRSDVVG